MCAVMMYLTFRSRSLRVPRLDLAPAHDDKTRTPSFPHCYDSVDTNNIGYTHSDSVTVKAVN